MKNEVKFWDNHDAGDYPDELRAVKGVYKSSGKTKTTMTIRLDAGLKSEIKKVAQTHDISTSSLVRMWMVDKLKAFAC